MTSDIEFGDSIVSKTFVFETAWATSTLRLAGIRSRSRQLIGNGRYQRTTHKMTSAGRRKPRNGDRAIGHGQHSRIGMVGGTPLLSAHRPLLNATDPYTLFASCRIQAEPCFLVLLSPAVLPVTILVHRASKHRAGRNGSQTQQ
jgi:hypothetical protein